MPAAANSNQQRDSKKPKLSPRLSFPGSQFKSSTGGVAVTTAHRVLRGPKNSPSISASASGNSTLQGDYNALLFGSNRGPQRSELATAIEARSFDAWMHKSDEVEDVNFSKESRWNEFCSIGFIDKSPVLIIEKHGDNRPLRRQTSCIYIR